ncbi:MAG: hypothetical protein OD814_000051 [Candidatus Alkanophagales archaeon MCA70_species_1]|nr:hypothetical protein [Candidatus Alkanophaga volatiphilum]
MQQKYILPVIPGISIQIVHEVLERFDVELVYLGEEYRGMAFRGDREELKRVKKFIYEKQKEYVKELEKKYGVGEEADKKWRAWTEYYDKYVLRRRR